MKNMRLDDTKVAKRIIDETSTNTASLNVRYITAIALISFFALLLALPYIMDTNKSMTAVAGAQNTSIHRTEPEKREVIAANEEEEVDGIVTTVNTTEKVTKEESTHLFSSSWVLCSGAIGMIIGMIIGMLSMKVRKKNNE
ncbi:MAG: hypothetical protein K6F77_00840 [Lachnospiraceae bacterium]|nr:hypothetical protein [Lachnospiraceae bacterium]